MVSEELDFTGVAVADLFSAALGLHTSQAVNPLFLESESDEAQPGERALVWYYHPDIRIKRWLMVSGFMPRRMR